MNAKESTAGFKARKADDALSGCVRSVILIDKPGGPTSFDVVETVSGMLGVKKAGHTGTLDPNATGLLVIALGEARKAMPVLTGLDKEYVGVIVLHGEVPLAKLKRAMTGFVGEITQTPPVRSAVARRPRQRRVHDIELLGLDGRRAEFRVMCEAGTYIRKIAHDLGESLGCGAHLLQLRRTMVGPFSVDKAVTIEELKKLLGSGKVPGDVPKGSLMPLEEALDIIGLPRIVIKDEYEGKVRNGSPIHQEFVKSSRHAGGEGAKEGSYVGVFNEHGLVVCLATMLAGDAGAVAKTERVFLP